MPDDYLKELIQNKFKEQYASIAPLTSEERLNELEHEEDYDSTDRESPLSESSIKQNEPSLDELLGGLNEIGYFSTNETTEDTLNCELTLRHHAESSSKTKHLLSCLMKTRSGRKSESNEKIAEILVQRCNNNDPELAKETQEQIANFKTSRSNKPLFVSLIIDSLSGGQKIASLLFNVLEEGLKNIVRDSTNDFLSNHYGYKKKLQPLIKILDKNTPIASKIEEASFFTGPLETANTQHLSTYELIDKILTNCHHSWVVHEEKIELSKTLAARLQDESYGPAAEKTVMDFITHFFIALHEDLPVARNEIIKTVINALSQGAKQTLLSKAINNPNIAENIRNKLLRHFEDEGSVSKQTNTTLKHLKSKKTQKEEAKSKIIELFECQTTLCPKKRPHDDADNLESNKAIKYEPSTKCKLSEEQIPLMFKMTIKDLGTEALYGSLGVRALDPAGAGNDFEDLF